MLSIDAEMPSDSFIQTYLSPAFRSYDSTSCFVIKNGGGVTRLALGATHCSSITLKQDTIRLYLTVFWYFVSVSKSPIF
jgi:hypothetical protein